MPGVRFDVLQDLAPRERDLASVELWERSLYRSRQRRRLAEVGRKSRRRRKSASLATTAALAAVPVIPQTLAAADVPGSSPSVAGAADANTATLIAAAQRVVLQEGSQGALVAALQTRLNQVLPLTHIAVDGIFGPQTRGAVVEFQQREGLPASGIVDARSWAALFNAPVLVFGGMGAGGPVSNAPSSGANGSAPTVVNVSHTSRAPTTGATRNSSSPAPSVQSPPLGGGATPNNAPGGPSGTSGPPGAAGPSNQGTPSNNTGPATPSKPSGPSNPSTGNSGAPPVSVVAPSPRPPQQSSTYVLTNGVALPLPRQYLANGSVDSGVDYAAPGGTPEYAMGDGVIIGEGISGFGPNAPILKITDGPLKGMEVYYGHAGPDRVRVGQHVHAGQQITIVGYGIVGISTGPHLEVGFYPVGPLGAGSRMLSVINSMLSQHRSGRAWGSGGKVLARTTRRRARTARVRRMRMADYGATGGGSGGASVGAAAVTSSEPAVVTSTPPAAPTVAPAAASTAAPPESGPTSPAPAVASSSPGAGESGDPTPATGPPADTGTDSTQATPTVEGAQTAPTTTSAPTTTKADGGSASTAVLQAGDTGVNGGGSSSVTPAGSSGAVTATADGGPVETVSGPQTAVPQVRGELSSTQSNARTSTVTATSHDSQSVTRLASRTSP